MRRLPPPTRETALIDLETAVGPFTRGGVAYGATPSQDDFTAILGLYDAYDGARGQWDRAFEASSLSAAVIASVRHAFTKTYSGGRLAHIRKALLDPNLLCPFCGIRHCRALDHFLPKADIGVFAIYARNLVPICDECNNLKGNRRGGVPNEQFVHAYFDELPDTPFLRAEITLEGAALNVFIRPDPTAGLSETLFERLTYQLEALDLDARYAREMNLYLSSQAPNWPDLHEKAGADGVANHLSRQGDYEATQHHQNDWRAVLCRALSTHQAFCNGGFFDVFAGLTRVSS